MFFCLIRSGRNKKRDSLQRLSLFALVTVLSESLPTPSPLDNEHSLINVVETNTHRTLVHYTPEQLICQEQIFGKIKHPPCLAKQTPEQQRKRKGKSTTPNANTLRTSSPRQSVAGGGGGWLVNKRIFLGAERLQNAKLVWR